MLGNVARVPKMLMEGVNVGIGTDMPIHDMFNVMRTVSQQHNIMPREIRGLTPWAPLEMATIGGARALNWQGEVGTLENGMKADIITLDLTCNTHMLPITREVLITYIIVNGSSRDVADVIVNGTPLMLDSKALHLDEDKIIERAEYWTKEFLAYYLDKREKGEALIPKVHEEFQP
jgi:5-methylthioadenosine/S-adenosylhomocysteine deaminase